MKKIIAATTLLVGLSIVPTTVNASTVNGYWHGTTWGKYNPNTNVYHSKGNAGYVSKFYIKGGSVKYGSTSGKTYHKLTPIGYHKWTYNVGQGGNVIIKGNKMYIGGDLGSYYLLHK